MIQKIMVSNDKLILRPVKLAGKMKEANSSEEERQRN